MAVFVFFNNKVLGRLTLLVVACGDMYLLLLFELNRNHRRAKKNRY